MSPWTQYEIDMREPDNDPDISISILRNGNDLVYAVGPNPDCRHPLSSPAWSLFKLNCAVGSCLKSRHQYPSFIEATRAFRSGAVIWGE